MTINSFTFFNLSKLLNVKSNREEPGRPRSSNPTGYGTTVTMLSVMLRQSLGVKQKKRTMFASK
jgi:hypothetical protein